MLFDVDGVLTDGTLWITPAPPEPRRTGTAAPASKSKGFSAHDGVGFSLARLAGLKIGWITKRPSETVAIRARDLRLDFVYQGQSDKVVAMQQICEASGRRENPRSATSATISSICPSCGASDWRSPPPTPARIVKAAAHFVTEH